MNQAAPGMSVGLRGGHLQNAERGAIVRKPAFVLQWGHKSGCSANDPGVAAPTDLCKNAAPSPD